MNEGTPEENPDRADRMARLINLAVELTGEVEDLARDSGHQFTSLAKTARTNRLMIWGVIGGGLLDVILTIVLGVVGAGVIDNTNRLDDFSKNLAAQQTEQRRRALCPLYGIFLDSKSDAGRNAAPDKAKYDHSFEVIEDGYRVLGCARFLEESGRDKW